MTAGMARADDADDDLTVNSAEDPSTIATTLPKQVMTFRVAWHPDIDRVGEVVLLSAIDRGAVGVTREEPAFGRPGRGRRGIETSYLSRDRPAFSVQGAGRGAVQILPGTAETRVKVDDQVLSQPRHLPREALERGVVIVVAQRIVLVLRLGAGASARGDDLGLAGVSEAVEGLRQQIRQVAPLAKDVLVRGETGSGKELVARAVHEASPRASRPFHAINMGRLVPATAASELFGHERGAFTGATDRHPGAFGLAEGGSLFLDEIGETPPEIQTMLLRALEAREIHPVGARQPRKVDVRLVLATDADLEGQVGAGRFDGALLSRLGHYTIKVPPMRDRREDIGLLLTRFLTEDFAREGLETPTLGEWLPGNIAAKAILAPWAAGNVRELKRFATDLFVRFRAVDRVTFDATIEQALAASLPAPAAAAPPPYLLPTARPRSGRIDPDLVARVYDETGRSPGKAAKALGMSPKTVYRVLRENPGIGSVAADIPAHELLRVYSEVDGDLGKMAERFKTTARALRQRLSVDGLVVDDGDEDA
jgi:two-component system nitrogen regulation response regulator GlnG